MEPYPVQPQSGGEYTAPTSTIRRPLRAAVADFARNTMTVGVGQRLDGADPLPHFAERQDVLIWGLQPVAPRAEEPAQPMPATVR